MRLASGFLCLLFPHNPFLLHVNNSNTQLCLKLWCQRLLAYSTCNIPKISSKLLLFPIIQDPNFEQNAKKNVTGYTDFPLFPEHFIYHLYCPKISIMRTPSEMIVQCLSMDRVLSFPREKSQSIRLHAGGFLRGTFMVDIYEGLKEVELCRWKN